MWCVQVSDRRSRLLLPSTVDVLVQHVTCVLVSCCLPLFLQDAANPGFMGDFLRKKKVVEDVISQLGAETRLLEELQERSALAVDAREEAGSLRGTLCCGVP